MNFEYEVVRLWERPAEELLAGDVGVAPLAVLGKLPEDLPFEEAIKGVAQRVVERLLHEVAADRAKKLLTEALLLTGLRIKRDVAENIFRGVQMMEESDTYLMIKDRTIRPAISRPMAARVPSASGLSLWSSGGCRPTPPSYNWGDKPTRLPLPPDS